MNIFVVIIGGGGHAKVLAEVLMKLDINIIGYIDVSVTGLRVSDRNIKYLGNDDCIEQYNKNDVMLVNGIGSTRETGLRRQIFKKYKTKGFKFYSIFHGSATISSDVSSGEGVQVMAGAIIQPGTKIGDNTIINTGASIDHDCIIGQNVHISPGVTLSGGVAIHDNVHVGVGTNIIQGITIGKGTTIGAGSLVIKDMPAGVVCYGIPAKIKGTDERL